MIKKLIIKLLNRILAKKKYKYIQMQWEAAELRKEIKRMKAEKQEQ